MTGVVGAFPRLEEEDGMRMRMGIEIGIGMEMTIYIISLPHM